MLGRALDSQPEFWRHVDAIRRGADPAAVARKYVRRDQSGRLAAIRYYLKLAAAAPDRRAAQMRLWVAGGAKAYRPGGSAAPGDPQRAVRRDALEVLAVGAVRVARRGAGRCVAHDCSVEGGAPLAADNRDDYCVVCASRGEARRPREGSEAERALFRAVTAAVLPDAPDRNRARRLRRHKGTAARAAA